MKNLHTPYPYAKQSEEHVMEKRVRSITVNKISTFCVRKRGKYKYTCTSYSCKIKYWKNKPKINFLNVLHKEGKRKEVEGEEWQLDSKYI